MRSPLNKRRFLAAALVLTLAASYGATGVAHADETPTGSSVQGQADSTGGTQASAPPAVPLRRQARRATCRVMDDAEWYLITGQYSEYGGTLCTLN